MDESVVWIGASGWREGPADAATASRLVNREAAPCSPPNLDVGLTVFSISLIASISCTSFSPGPCLPSLSGFRCSTSPLTSSISLRNRASFRSKLSSFSSTSSSLLNRSPSTPSLLCSLLPERYPFRLLAIRVAEVNPRSLGERKWVRASSGWIPWRSMSSVEDSGGGDVEV